MPLENFEFEEKTSRKKIFILIIIFAALIILAGLYFTYFIRPKTPVTPVTLQKSEVIIFSPSDRTRLAKKTLTVREGLSEKVKADIIIRELKKEKVVPDGLTLHESTIDDNGVIYLNFSTDLIQEKPNSTKEITMLYSIVNSFISNYNNAKSVQILVEGNPVDTINGTLYIYRPIIFNKDLTED